MVSRGDKEAERTVWVESNAEEDIKWAEEQGLDQESRQAGAYQSQGTARQEEDLSERLRDHQWATQDCSSNASTIEQSENGWRLVSFHCVELHKLINSRHYEP